MLAAEKAFTPDGRELGGGQSGEESLDGEEDSEREEARDEMVCSYEEQNWTQ